MSFALALKQMVKEKHINQLVQSRIIMMSALFLVTDWFFNQIGHVLI